MPPQAGLILPMSLAYEVEKVAGAWGSRRIAQSRLPWVEPLFGNGTCRAQVIVFELAGVERCRSAGCELCINSQPWT